VTTRSKAADAAATTEDTPIEGQTTVEEQVVDSTPPVGNVNGSSGPVEQADPVLEDRDPLGGVPIPEPAETTGQVLIVHNNNGTTSEVELEDGSIVEYIGASFARYVPKGEAPVTVNVGTDVQALQLKGVEG